MNPHPSRHSQRGGKVEASAERPAWKAKDNTPMARFKSLARSLLTVSNRQLREEQQRYEKGKDIPNQKQPG
jgi:hypothetical protein